MARFYAETGRLIRRHGAQVLRPGEGLSLIEPGRWLHASWRAERRRIAYLEDVAVVSARSGPVHTHGPEAMERILLEVRPDLVFADHGFAGAAIEAGVDTVSIADVNDPALIVARAQGRSGPVIVMDDNVRPEDYWPCFQAFASRIQGA